MSDAGGRTLRGYRPGRGWGMRRLALAILTALALSATGCVSTGSDTEGRTPEPAPMFSGAPDEHADAMVACLVDAGWNAERDPTALDGPGAWMVDTPAGQDDLLREAVSSCLSTVGQPWQPSTDAELAATYAWLMEQWVCLDGAGFAPSPPPSEQQWIELSRSGEGGWSPYSEFPAGELNRAYEACPITSVPGPAG